MSKTPKKSFKVAYGEDFLFPSEREKTILKEAAEKADIAEVAIVKRWVRLGQMLDRHMTEEPNTTVGYLDDQGDFHGFFDHGPKKAPMPAPAETEHLDGWENEGGA